MKAEVILGNPGTGKTYTLTKRIEELKNRYSKTEIQVLSHTKVAAKEIADRAEGAMASTIHSLAYKFGEIIADQVASTLEIIKFAEKIGIPIKGVGDDSTASVEVGDEYMGIISLANNWLTDPIEYYKSNPGLAGSLDEFTYFYKSYINWKRTYGMIDFDDMIMKCENFKPEFKVLFVDEAQDLSPLQWQFISNILKTKKIEQVTITGDPDQSLFVWGGADPEGMQKFGKQHNAKLTELAQSYRVPAKIHDIGTRIIRKVVNRYEKDYSPTNKEGEVIYYNNPMMINWPDFAGKDVMVLYRTHSLRREVEEELIHHSLPYTCLSGKKAMFDSKHGFAFRMIEKIGASGDYTLSANQINLLKSVSTIAGERLLRQHNIRAYIKHDPSLVIAFPSEQFGYFRDVYKRGLLNDPNPIKLSTVHGAKGMEADIVIILNGMTGKVVDSMEEDPDQEHRVWFVAVTRSKNTLIWVDSMEGDNYEIN